MFASPGNFHWLEELDLVACKLVLPAAVSQSVSQTRVAF